MPDNPPPSPQSSPPESDSSATPSPPPAPGLQPAPPQQQATLASQTPQNKWLSVGVGMSAFLLWAVVMGLGDTPLWLRGILTLLWLAGCFWIGATRGRRLRDEKKNAAQAWADALARTVAAQTGASGAPANPWDLTAGGGSQADPNLPAPFIARSALVTRAALFRAAVGALRNPYSYLALVGIGLIFVVSGGMLGAITFRPGAGGFAVFVAALVGAGYALGGALAFFVFILALTIPATAYSRSVGGVATVSLHHDGVRERTPERALLLPWTRITGIRDISGDIHFWVSGSLGAVAPREGFANDMDRTAFLEQAERLWRSRGGDWR